MALDRDREIFPGKTRMHASMRQFDWGGSPLGEPQAWPKSLRAIVSLMLDSTFPMCLSWGPELRFLYNDAFLPIAGQRDPAAFGARMQDVWSGLWPAMDAVVNRALGGEPGSFENFPVDVVRYGRPARRWFSFSCTPVRDDEGRIAGVICIGNETTEQVLMGRHHAFELQASDHLRSMSDPDEVAAHACRLVGLHLGVARVGYIEVDEVQQALNARPDWTNGELPSLGNRSVSIDGFGAAALGQLRVGRILQVNDSTAEEESVPLARHVSAGARSMMAVPLIKSGGLCAVLHLEQTHPRLWSENEIALAEEMVERIWAAVERAKADERRRAAEEEVHGNAERLAFQLELSDLLRPLTDADAVIAAASGLLGSRLGVSRIRYVEVAADGTFHARCDWSKRGFASAALGVNRLDDFGPDIIEVLRSGAAVAVDDIARDTRTTPHAGAYATVGVRSFLALPLVKSGRLAILLILLVEEPYHWTQLDLQRVQDMAERTWFAAETARAQIALRAERDRSQYVLDTMTEGFAMVGADSTLLQMNAEGLRLARLTQAVAIGRKLTEIWPKARASALGDLFRRVKKTGRAESLEYKRTAPDGRISWLEIRAYPVLGGGLGVFYSDITKRKQAEQKLRDADRRKDEFVATLAHELRNPIAPITSAAAVLSMPGLKESDVRRAGELISRQAANMTGLVNQLLDISRVTSGVVKLHPDRLDLNQIVPEAVEQADPLIKSHAHHLEVLPSAEPALVWGDRPRLVQVLANLLNNAAKYTPDGGKIVLQVRTEEDYVVACVADNGIGMAPELVESAFELFAQAERTPDRVEGGLGIGLALVKGIVELHGGAVSAHSEGLGRGSEFRVLLPRLANGEGALDLPRVSHS